MEYKNSSGYFADPNTEQMFTVDTQRCVPCSFEDGKFVWPMVLLSDGTPVKIVYKLFTEEEKELYKAYRGRGTGESKPKPKPKPKTEKPVKETKPVEQKTDEPEVVKYDTKSASSSESLAKLSQCDRILGVTQIAGVTYALCSRFGWSVVYHIPRSCIPDAEFKRLCEGMA